MSPPRAPAPAHLRHRAEARLRAQQKTQRLATGKNGATADQQRLLHELQVHQVELEMQNAELQEARDQTGALLEKYTDLYDFAPVGYFSLDDQGRILEANLTGAALLGMERSRVLHQPLARFAAPAGRPLLQTFLERVFAEPGPQACEVSLLKLGDVAFWASLHAASVASSASARPWCRVAVSDITALKRADEAQRRSEALAMSNRELTQEVVRRRAAEAALAQSQQHQTDLLEKSHRMQAQLRHFSHQILRAQEEERKRISRELHDGITQTLVGINVHLENLARDFTGHPKTLTRHIAQTQRLVEKSVKIVHQFARELRPTALDDLGLVATLHSFMKDSTKRTGLHVHFKTFTAGQTDEFDNATRTVSYRVAQEALTNVARHAHATRVDLTIQKLPGALLLQIKDNGKSFQVDRVLHATRSKHLGLLGMRERVEMIGGRLSVESAPRQGTTIRAEIPFRSSPARGTSGVKKSHEPHHLSATDK